MENYICINGKKAELTEEQMKALGIELPKANPLHRAEFHNVYYAIDTGGVVRKCVEKNDGVDNVFYNIANYCTDKETMEQRALHETLNRLLLRYSMEHDGDKINWNNTSACKWYIYYDLRCNNWNYDKMFHSLDFGVFFYSNAIANNAIKEIIEPFMKAHPEFKW